MCVKGRRSLTKHSGSQVVMTYSQVVIAFNNALS